MKKINSLQYNTMVFFLIKSCFIELTFTNIIARVHQDAWICVLIGSIFGIIPFGIYEYLKVNYPDDNIISLNRKLFKGFGGFLNFIIFLGSFICLICTFWLFIHFSNALFLYKTNPWIISLAFIIPIGYAVICGIRVISKVSLMLFYVALLFIITIIFGLYGGADLNNMKPIFESDFTSILFSSIMFTALNTVKVIFLSFIPKNQIEGYSIKKIFLFYVLGCLSLFNVTILTISVFGIDLTMLYQFPGFEILKRVNILGIFDRIESLLSIEWIFSLFIQIALVLYGIKVMINERFSLKQKTNKYLIVFICLVILIISNNIFINYEVGEDFFTGPLVYIIYFTFLFIPLITLFKSIYDTEVIEE